jgi:hypothetical protein
MCISPCARSMSFFLADSSDGLGDGGLAFVLVGRTGTAEDAGDLDELDGDLGGFHCEVDCDELGWRLL